MAQALPLRPLWRAASLLRASLGEDDLEAPHGVLLDCPVAPAIERTAHDLLTIPGGPLEPGRSIRLSVAVSETTTTWSRGRPRARTMTGRNTASTSAPVHKVYGGWYLRVGAILAMLYPETQPVVRRRCRDAPLSPRGSRSHSHRSLACDRGSVRQASPPACHQQDEGRPTVLANPAGIQQAMAKVGNVMPENGQNGRLAGSMDGSEALQRARMHDAGQQAQQAVTSETTKVSGDATRASDALPGGGHAHGLGRSSLLASATPPDSAAAIPALLVKLAAQDNACPQRSTSGEAHGLSAVPLGQKVWSTTAPVHDCEAATSGSRVLAVLTRAGSQLRVRGKACPR